jgi:hypothetical protein
MKLVVAVIGAMLLVVDTATAAIAPPTNAHVTGQTQTSISIAWSGSTSRYAVFQDGTKITRLSGKAYTFTGLRCGSTYQLGVRSVSGSKVSAIVTITGTTVACQSSGSPPPPEGFFSLRPVGSWSSLPDDIACTTQVHRSTWEPRPWNTKRNHVLVDPAAVHNSLAARPRNTGGGYDSRWGPWLMQRVDGQFEGTTDEIFQWAACKWGLPDNVLRGIAVRESTWYQYVTYPSGRCYPNWSCGDFITTATSATRTYCDEIARFGYDYQQDYGAGLCPKTFSITGIMSWEDPAWGPMAGNQNGTFPFNRNSTAFAEDYIGSYLRGCYEGWVKWLGPSGDLWGCVGSWYSGDWHSSAANGYIDRVQTEISNHRWLQPDWPDDKPSCSTTYGCPGPDALP